MMLSLDRYFERIAFTLSPRVDIETLTMLHRLHLRAIPYENLDIQLGAPLTIDEADAFEKLVTRRRGGWCYEMNGLFGWVLRTIGFQVTPVAAGATRETRGDRMLGNHLALIVHLDQDYLVDVGFAEGQSEPLPLREGRYRQGVLQYGLEQAGESYWRFMNHSAAAVQSFDFRVLAADADLLAAQSAWLQTASESPFVNTALCFIFDAEGIAMLRERTFKRIDRYGIRECTVADIDEYRATLEETFNLQLLPEQVRKVWSQIEQRAEPLATSRI